MIALALSLALASQAMTQADMLDEGRRIGSTAAALGACKSFGYDVSPEVGQTWAEDYGRRAHASGWSDAVVTAAIDAGQSAEMAEIAPSDLTGNMPEAEVRKVATAFIGRIKDRCHRLHAESAGVISNLEAGDRNADAKLAILLEPFNR